MFDHYLLLILENIYIKSYLGKGGIKAKMSLPVSIKSSIMHRGNFAMEDSSMNNNDSIKISLDMERLPSRPIFEPGIRRAPRREADMSPAQERLALRNALRYIPPRWHAELASEFLAELREHGRIYGYRFRPAGNLRGLPIDSYPGRCIEGRGFPRYDRQQLGLQCSPLPL